MFNRIIIVIIVTSALLAGCGVSGTNDSFDVAFDPSFICSNAEPGTWSYLGIPGETISSIAINPHNARHILVGTSGSISDGSQGKIFMSTDCGENWEQVWEGGNILEIHFDPKSPNVVYANPHGMIRSTDWGRSWSDRSNGLTDYLSFTSAVTTFAIDQEQPNRLYAGTQDLGGGLVFYTDNAGSDWQLIPSHQQQSNGTDLSKSAVLFIHVDPVYSDHIYIGNGPIMRSTDRGLTWEMLRETDPNVIQTMAFSADHSKIYAMNTWRGFYEFDMPDGPWAFTPYPDSLVGTHISSIIDTDLIDGILLGTGRGVMVRKNNEFYSMVDNLPYTITSQLILNGNNLYAAVRPQSGFISTNSGIFIRRLKLNK